MCTGFANKVVLVTGSSSGIGMETILRFASLGARCLVHGRDSERVSRVARQCAEVSPSREAGIPLVADVTSEQDLTAMMATITQRFDRLDVLVNNAGYGFKNNIFQDNPLELLDQHYSGMVRAPMSIIHKCLGLLKAARGSIVNISSITGVKPFNHSTGYCVARAGMNMLTRCLAVDLGPLGIRVNAVAPAQINTGSFTRFGMTADVEAAMWQYAANEYPLRRAGRSVDVVNAVTFLASDAASFITGQIIILDGGYLDSQPQIMADYGKPLKDL